jgi:transposase
VQIILGQARRRWSEDEKGALVAETFVDGQTVNGVAHRHNISRSMLFGWRKQYCETLGFAAPASAPIGFTPVATAQSEASGQAIPPSAPARVPLIELELGRGVRLRIFGAVDPDLAAAVK